MENKYYIPEIEEFHIGFRHEWRVAGRPGCVITLKDGNELKEGEVGVWTGDNYTPPVGSFTGEEFYDGVIDPIEAGNLRVKYLDNADIEELGWKHLKDSLFHIIKDYYESWQLRYYPDKNKVVIKIFEDTEDGEVYTPLFKGTIKNYNELQTLMKQLSLI